MFSRFLLILCVLIQFCIYSAAQESFSPVTDNVHTFYYAWYANVETDGHWSHWNHTVIHRDKPNEHPFTPPDEIGANFYPQLGCYSCHDPETLLSHMRQMKQAGTGVAVVSWWGKKDFSDQAVPLILKAAEEVGIKITFHIEPYPQRSALSVRDTIKYLLDNYGNSPAFYRVKSMGNRPLFYVYDSYLTEAKEWATVLSPKGEHTIRGTNLDAVMIGLWVKEGDGAFMKTGHFDGFYTYFATTGFTYGSTPENWQAMMKWAEENDKLFIPSVGPGYIDTRIRPWNERNTRDREEGDYYDRMFKAAIDVRSEMISITSFNEWHEGTQIEPSIPKQIENFTYLDFLPHSPDYYLKRTRFWSDQFMK